MSLGLIVLLALVLAAIISWPVMLLFGAIHATHAVIPAFGYWVTYAWVLIVRLVTL